MGRSESPSLVLGNVLRVVTLLSLIMGSTYSFDLLNTTCSGNSLIVSHGSSTATQPCAWQCVRGECINGWDLAANAFLVLFISWGVAGLLLWFSTRFTRDEYLTTIFRFITMLIMVVGILATLGVYNGTVGLGVPIKDLMVGMANSLPLALVLAILLWIIIKILEQFYQVYEGRGGIIG